jgi:NitT/TauT family transport system permease protein
MMTEVFAAPLAPRRPLFPDNILPVGIVLGVIVILWYIAAVPMNAVIAGPKIGPDADRLEQARVSWSLDRPVLPAPHQVLAELWTSVFTVAPTKPRSLLFHSWVTLSSTVVGFFLGTVFGVGLAIAIVHVRTLNKSLMPWIIASQTVPILAVAPMIIVVLGSVGFVGLLPKSIISTYLCFFPVTIGMVKGLTSPERMLLDLMETYNANAAQILWKLRWPASLPFLFASLKVAIAIALVGAIVGELPTGAQAGIGARLLTGSYYGQTIQIWAALFAAAIMAAVLVWSVGVAERATVRRMGGAG